jgi:hypothetical protein
MTPNRLLTTTYFTAASRFPRGGTTRQSIPIRSRKRFDRSNDVTGLSVVRGEPYNTVEQAARGPSKWGYYVVILRAGDLRAHGVDVVPRPVDGVPGHAEITNLTAANRDSDEAQRIMELLAEKLCLRVEGPFHQP